MPQLIFSMLLLSFAAHIFASHTKAKAAENNFQFERFECAEPNPEFLSQLKCEIKPIARNVLKANITIGLKQVLKSDIWVHTMVYYRYNTYKKLVDLSEELCGFLRGVNKSPILNMMMENYNEMDVHLNFKLQCPFSGNLILTHDGLNSSQISLPLIAAGRFRVDFNFTKGKNGIYLGFSQLYFSISDLRVFQWR